MSFVRSYLRRAVAVAALSLPAMALSHEVWIQRVDGSFLLREGHAEAPRAVDAAKVTAVRCARRQGVAELRERLANEGGELRIAASCDALLVALDHGSWSLTPDGEVNRPRSQVPDAVKAWQSRACAKWVDPTSDVAAQPFGAELELVLAKRAEVRQGEKIALRVLAAGAPAPGAVISIGHRVVGETDGAGEVRVRIRERGLQVVSASLRRRVQTPDADAVVLEATLAFEVAR